MKSRYVMYGVEGPVEGMPNAEGVPAHVPAQNILEWDEYDVPDVRPMLQHRAASGDVYTYALVRESDRGHKWLFADESAPAPPGGRRVGGRVEVEAFR